MEKIKIGFLPFYIKLYDDCGSGAKWRPRLEPFYDRLTGELEAQGFEVVTNPFCRIKEEFAAAVKKFEDAGCTAIVTWHAAYSPSLESIDALAGTDLPLIILDTTETFSFEPAQNPDEISVCHGIHGVMDMCSMLRRYGKPFAIAAGHLDHSDVIARVSSYVRAAAAAKSLKGSRTGSIGGSFDGMGDFITSDEDMLRRFGVTVVYPEDGVFADYRAKVTDAEVEAEIAEDNAATYVVEPFAREVHERNARNCLAVRKWIADQKLDSFTANFRAINPPVSGLEIMPFTEACKALARGTGYAGEGDVLTASLVGALLKGFKDSTFVEIFCPDWKGNTLLLSHMGEYNAALTVGKRGMKEMPFIYGGAKNPMVQYARYRGGQAVFLNLYHTKEDFKLLISDVDMVEVNPDDDNFTTRVRGWMKPHMPIAQFLEELSFKGATHHSALVYGATVRELQYFAELLGIEYDVI